MYFVYGYFVLNGGVSDDASRLMSERVDAALAPVVPESYVRHRCAGDGWGVLAGHSADWSSWRWPLVAQDGDVTAVSFGVPVGADVSGGPTRMAGRLLAGEDVHAPVVPPFGLLAVRDGRAELQQDWLGMCRIFVGRTDDFVVFASRPGVVARALGIPLAPDLDGWSSYVSAGHFAGDSSPYAGVRLMEPGARLSAARRPGGGWDVTHRQGFSVDDLMRRAVAAQAECSFDDLLELAGTGLGTAATSLAALYDGPLRLALSGGKDSRVIAAATIGAGLVPAFNTNIDTRAEGETASRLTGILREKLGVEIEHRLAASSPVGRVTETDLTERVRRLQAEYDYQYPSTYSIRPARSGRLVEQVSVALSGAGGELAVGNWYPPEFTGDCSRATADELIRRKLLATATPLGAVHPDVRERERARLLTITDRAEAAGLTGLKLCDYAYLMERMRRWATLAYGLSRSMFLAPDFVVAAFALDPQLKPKRTLHHGLIRRYVPEWADVPFVSINTGPSTVTRIWDGTGLASVHGLLDTVHGDLQRLIRREVVADTVLACAVGRVGTPQEKVLQQYAALAVACGAFEPDGVRPATQSYQAFVRPHLRATRVPRAMRRVIAPVVRQVKRTGLGRRVLAQVRTRVNGRKGTGR
ncbi:asparagine synthetase B family protein [Catellatospora vulcania]|uniref:hypothetical protein n=1 Tax=Catellatospora vulcania TaxID=1460450 RepID=UPI0012D4A489|nr:hypothetical protein [Catellatospora vulcania]